MENYKVKALFDFDDYLGKEAILENKHIKRYSETKEHNASVWNVTKERYEYLKSRNAVELIEILKEEEQKEEMTEEKDEIEEEIKKIVKSRKRRTK